MLCRKPYNQTHQVVRMRRKKRNMMNYLMHTTIQQSFSSLRSKPSLNINKLDTRMMKRVVNVMNKLHTQLEWCPVERSHKERWWMWHEVEFINHVCSNKLQEYTVFQKLHDSLNSKTWSLWMLLQNSLAFFPFL